MTYYKYCPKCGVVTFGSTVTNCYYCNEPLIVTEYEWIVNDGGRGVNKRKEIFENYVKPNPLFDEELYNKRIAKENANIYVYKSSSDSKNVPKCPTCGSTNIKRISTLDRAASIGVFGIFSGKIGKNYECLNCKAKW